MALPDAANLLNFATGESEGMFCLCAFTIDRKQLEEKDKLVNQLEEDKEHLISKIYKLEQQLISRIEQPAHDDHCGSIDEVRIQIKHKVLYHCSPSS